MDTAANAGHGETGRNNRMGRKRRKKGLGKERERGCMRGVREKENENG